MGGREVACDDDGALVHIGDGFLPAVPEVSKEPVCQVTQVIDLGAEGGVWVGGELLGEFSEGRGDRKLSVDMILLDGLSHGGEHGWVVEHADMEEEDFGGFLAHFDGGGLVQLIELVDGGFSGELEAFEFGGDIGLIDGSPGDPQRSGVVDEEDTPDDDAGGDRDAADLVHKCGSPLGGACVRVCVGPS